MRLKDKIIHRMVELAGDETSGWTALPTSYGGARVRYTETLTTPDYARSSERGAWKALWDQDTYDRHVFLTLVAGKFILGVASAPVAGKFILGVASAPWVGRNDSDAPLWLVEAILEDPDLAHDTSRIWAMRDARKAARS